MYLMLLDECIRSVIDFIHTLKDIYTLDNFKPPAVDPIDPPKTISIIYKNNLACGIVVKLLM